MACNTKLKGAQKRQNQLLKVFWIIKLTIDYNISNLKQGNILYFVQK